MPGIAKLRAPRIGPKHSVQQIRAGLMYVKDQPRLVRNLEDQIVTMRMKAGERMREIRLALGMSLNDVERHQRRLKVKGPRLYPGTVSRLETGSEWRPLVVGGYVFVLDTLANEAER